jgi:small subunit ribosomal protein S2
MQKTQDNKELIQSLLASGVQFGHKSSRFHPGMTPYIWGVRNGMHLIDLNKTAFLINHACEQIEEVTSQGGQVLWVGTKRQAQKAIAECGIALNHPTVIHRWIGGTLTNSEQVRKAITKLLHMRDVIAKPLAHYKKKQISMLKKDLDRLEKNVSGIINLKPKLALLVVVDVKRESTAVKEASRSGIPVIGIVDTNSSPETVDTAIPANDDAKESVEFIVKALLEAAQRGVSKYRAAHPEKEILVSTTIDKTTHSSTPGSNAAVEPRSPKEGERTFTPRRVPGVGARPSGGRDSAGTNQTSRPFKAGGRTSDQQASRHSNPERRGGRPVATVVPTVENTDKKG